MLNGLGASGPRLRGRHVIYSFGRYELDTDRLVLSCDGEPVRVEPQVFDVLAHLLANRNRVVSKEELLDEVWGDRFVSESALTTRIRMARKALGDDGNKQALIRTVHGRGYEFIAEVTDGQVGEPPVAVASRLPSKVQALVGRDAVLEALVEEFDDCRLLTLVGSAGVGKTTLAYELARQVEDRFGDGVYPCEMVAVVDADACIEVLATALDVHTRQEGSLEDAVVDVLRSREAMLLLDNCEHLVEPLSLIVDRILGAAPGVTVLATSREPLAVASERVWPVEPLPFALEPSSDPDLLLEIPAIALFVARAKAADPAFALTVQNVGSVVEICRRLDGVPLAIELAAARARAIDVSDIAARLDERFRLLKGVRRATDPRHQALDDAVRWSYDLLEDVAQRLFSRLSVFAGQFDLNAAERVCGSDDIDVLDTVTRLAERSMVTVRRPAEGGTRYEQLETLRAYGRSRLDDDEIVDLSARHTHHYADLAREVETALGGPSEADAVSRADGAFSELRAAQRSALQVGDLDHGFALIVALHEYAMRTMRYEALGWADSAVAVPGAEEHDLYPTLLGIQAYSAWMRGEFTRALDLSRMVSAIEADRQLTPCGLAERTTGNVQYVLGETEAGLITTRRQLDLAEADGTPSRIVHASYMHSIALSLHDLEESRRLADRARLMAERSGSPTDAASALVAAAFSAADQASALDAFERADQHARKARNRWLSAFARTEFYGLLLAEGRLQEACGGLAEMVDVWFRAGEWSQQWVTLSRCVVALTATGQAQSAAEIIGAVNQHAVIAATPVVATLRDRTLEAEGELRSILGDEEYQRCRAIGAEMPVVEVVHSARAALAVDR